MGMGDAIAITCTSCLNSKPSRLCTQIVNTRTPLPWQHICTCETIQHSICSLSSGTLSWCCKAWYLQGGCRHYANCCMHASRCIRHHLQQTSHKAHWIVDPASFLLWSSPFFSLLLLQLKLHSRSSYCTLGHTRLVFLDPCLAMPVLLPLTRFVTLSPAGQAACGAALGHHAATLQEYSLCRVETQLCTRYPWACYLQNLNASQFGVVCILTAKIYGMNKICCESKCTSWWQATWVMCCCASVDNTGHYAQCSNSWRFTLANEVQCHVHMACAKW